MLREVFEKLDGRLTAVEGHCDPDAICLSAVETQPGLAPSVTGLPLAVLERPMGPGPVSCPPSAADGCSTAARGETDGGRPAQSVDPALGRTQTPPWSMVVKDGCRLKQVSENPAHRSPTPRTVKTPASDYLKMKLNREVTCRKIEATQSRFSSFCISGECNDVAELYDPQLWPAGTFVRCYYEARRPRGADGGLSGPEDAPRSRDEGLLHVNDARVPAVVVGEDGMKASCSAGNDKTL
ncbi:unnamed protein product [Leuciscus chuanchicus]